MHELRLVFITSFYIVLILSFLYWDSIRTKDKFSPIKVLCYFSFIDAFVLGWFSFNTRFIDNYILKIMSSDFQTYALVEKSYLMSVFSFFLTAMGIKLSCYLKLKHFQAPQFPRDRLFWQALLFTSLLSYCLFIYMIGGGAVWNNISKRTFYTQGWGYLELFYTYSLFLSSAYMFIYQKNFLYRFFLISLTLVVLGSLTQRYPVGLFIFFIIIVYHYKICPIRFLSKGFFSVLIFCLILMQLFVTFRHIHLDKKYRSFSSASEIIRRFGKIERNMVALGYFEANDYFGIKLYETLIYSPIPRRLISNKPPIDTGVYLKKIADEGISVSKKEVFLNYDRTSWPDGNLAGFMAWGWKGFISMSILSGFIYGLVYFLVQNSGYSIVYLFIYTSWGFLGIRSLSPFDIMTSLFQILFLSFLFGMALIYKTVRGKICARII